MLKRLCRSDARLRTSRHHLRHRADGGVKLAVGGLFFSANTRVWLSSCQTLFAFGLAVTNEVL